MATGAAQRLVSGDSLDQAMYGVRAAGVGDRATPVRSGPPASSSRRTAPGSVHDDMAGSTASRLRRELLQHAVRPARSTRAVGARRRARSGPAQDEAAWLEVNNRAFAWHPEQGDWTIDDAARARGASRGSTRRASCCTSATVAWPASAGRRSTHDERPPLGEIYVIGVDPDFHGQGLGRPLRAGRPRSTWPAASRRAALHRGRQRAGTGASTSARLRVVARHCWSRPTRPGAR